MSHRQLAYRSPTICRCMSVCTVRIVQDRCLYCCTNSILTTSSTNLRLKTDTNSHTFCHVTSLLSKYYRRTQQQSSTKWYDLPEFRTLSLEKMPFHEAKRHLLYGKSKILYGKSFDKNEKIISTYKTCHIWCYINIYIALFLVIMHGM